MKKLSLEMLRFTSGEVLQRSEMKKITGGGRWKCVCSGSPGTYTGTYSSYDAAMSSALTWCASNYATCTEAIA
jgi:hypothetical protein